MQILSSAVSVDDRAQQRGLQQIKDTINEG